MRRISEMSRSSDSGLSWDRSASNSFDSPVWSVTSKCTHHETIEEDEGFESAGSCGSRESRDEITLLNSNGRIREEVADNFKEILPLVEPFLEDQKENDRAKAFIHHGPLAYTRAPCRYATKKKLPLNDESNKPSNNEEPALSMNLNKAELLKLQSQVGELKVKVRGKEELLQSIWHSEIPKVLEQAEVVELRSKVESLQRELRSRDCLLHSVHHQLQEKQVEVANMRLLIQGLQNEITRRDYIVFQMEDDLERLSFEVVTLRYQNQEMPYLGNHQEEYEQRVEELRRRYVAAVLAAKEKPVDEFIAHAAALRQRLCAFISLSHILQE